MGRLAFAVRSTETARNGCLAATTERKLGVGSATKGQATCADGPSRCRTRVPTTSPLVGR